MLKDEPAPEIVFNNFYCYQRDRQTSTSNIAQCLLCRFCHFTTNALEFCQQCAGRESVITGTRFPSRPSINACLFTFVFMNFEKRRIFDLLAMAKLATVVVGKFLLFALSRWPQTCFTLHSLDFRNLGDYRKLINHNLSALPFRMRHQKRSTDK